MKTAAIFSVLFTFITAVACAQVPLDLKKDRAELGKAFRATRGGVAMPSGPYYTDYIARADVVSTEPPTCASQILRMYRERWGEARSFSLYTEYRFLARNSGGALSQTTEALAQKCGAEPIDMPWFRIADEEIDRGIAAAWAASGTLVAIAEGRASYAGIDVSKFANKPSGSALMSIRAFSEHAAEAVSMVHSIQETPSSTMADASFVATVAIGGGRDGGGGCELEVQITFREHFDRQTAGRAHEIAAIDVGDVMCFVV